MGMGILTCCLLLSLTIQLIGMRIMASRLFRNIQSQVLPMQLDLFSLLTWMVMVMLMCCQHLLMTGKYLGMKIMVAQDILLYMSSLMWQTVRYQCLP